MDDIQVEEEGDTIGDTVPVQPITNHIRDLKDGTPDNIFALRSSLKTKKGFVTKTLKDARGTKVKLDAEIAKKGYKQLHMGLRHVLIC